jgi:hypothetical protein
LTGAFLGGADLTDANLGNANLTDAILVSANLTDATLVGTDLTDAILWGANLTDAILKDVIFGEKTVLPDAVELRSESGDYIYDEAGHLLFTSYWTPETDMSRYTDPNHPDYWNPCVGLTRFDRPWYCDNE